MAFDVYGDADKLGFGLWALSFVLVYAAGGISNFFLRRGKGSLPKGSWSSINYKTALN